MAGEKNTAELNRRYKALGEIARTVNSARPPREILDSIVKTTGKALSACASSLLFLDSGKKRLIHGVHYGLSDWYVRKGILDADRSLTEALEGKPVAVYDASQDPRVQYPDLAGKAGIASMLSVAVTVKGDVKAMLRVYTREAHRFSKAEEDFLGAVADLTAMALENARLIESVKAEQEGRKGAPTEEEALLAGLSKAPTFAHPSEEEFAHLLDFYQIEWLYEPRSFPLQWEDDRITEMFTPDFYLPALDLYIELTTMRQKLVTEKNRKLRRLKALYPDINVKLLYQKDYHRLLAKYGYGPLSGTKVQDVERVLFSTSQIENRVKKLGHEISADYKAQPLILIGVLRGVVCFMADLMRHISLRLAVDFMSISYYTEDVSGAVRITKDLDKSITGQHVLMVEDIVDTGMTLNYILNYLKSRKPASLKVCALLDKRVRRLVDVPLDYVGFEIPDEFVVGYGLDYQEEYRNLPFIGILKPEAGSSTSQKREGPAHRDRDEVEVRRGKPQP